MIWIVLLIAVLLGLSAGGTVWFAMDLSDKLRPKLRDWREARKEAKAAAALEEATEGDDDDGTDDQANEGADGAEAV